MQAEFDLPDLRRGYGEFSIPGYDFEVLLERHHAKDAAVQETDFHVAGAGLLVIRLPGVDARQPGQNKQRAEELVEHVGLLDREQVVPGRATSSRAAPCPRGLPAAARGSARTAASACWSAPAAG